MRKSEELTHAGVAQNGEGDFVKPTDADLARLRRLSVALPEKDQWALNALLADWEARGKELAYAAMSLDSYDRSCGCGGGTNEARDIATLLGFEGGGDEEMRAFLDAAMQKKGTHAG